MSDRRWVELEQLANEEAALRRRLMTAIFDDDSEEVERARAGIRDLEARRAGALTRIRSGFDVVA
jgi:hypothetical protein